MPKSVRELLDDHISTILSQIGPVRLQLAGMERELADARKARNALSQEGDAPSRTDALAEAIKERMRRHEAYMAEAKDKAGPAEEQPNSPYAKLTMKQLVRKALSEHFANGATAIEMLDFFRDAWGRDDVVRTSLSPQLSRLKRDGEIELDGMTWRLSDPDDLLSHNENRASTEYRRTP
jgi:hypothetical protein